MSSSVINQITFGSDTAARTAFQCMLHEMQAEGQPLGSIDFNKLIPMPQELDMRAGFVTHMGLKQYINFLTESVVTAQATLFASEAERTAIIGAHLAKWGAVELKDPEAWALGKKAFQNLKKYGCPTWVEWSELNWGTRDNAFNCTALDSASDTMVFQTTDAAVPKIAAALSQKFPAQKITYYWTDEKSKQRLGQMVFQDGDAIEVRIPDEPAALAHAMSAGVWQFQSVSAHSSCHTQNRPQKKSHRRLER